MNAKWIAVGFVPVLFWARQVPAQTLDVVPLDVHCHAQGIGDIVVHEGQLAGTTGEARRLEGLWARCAPDQSGLEIQGFAHLEGVGYTAWSSGFIGTKGESRRLEGFALRLSGPMAEEFSILYQAHLSNVGWTPMATDGEFVGTRGESRPIEGFVVSVIRRDLFRVANETGACCPESRARLGTLFENFSPSVQLAANEMNAKKSFLAFHLPVIGGPKTLMFKCARIECDPGERERGNKACPPDKNYHGERGFSGAHEGKGVGGGGKSEWGCNILGNIPDK